MSLAAAAICLMLGAKTVALPTDHLTLAWHHSVEKSGWEEDYLLRGGRLVLKEARIEGTGAGMEPPPDAVLRGGWWHYVPRLGPNPRRHRRDRGRDAARLQRPRGRPAPRSVINKGINKGWVVRPFASV